MRSRASRGRWTSVIICRCASTGQREVQAHQRSSGPPRRSRSRSAAWQSRHCRRDRYGRVRLVRDPVRSRYARGGSLRDRNRQSHGRRRVGEDAVDPPPRCSRGGCASRSHDRAHGDAGRGDRARSRKPGLRPLACGVFLAFVNGYWLGIAAPLASVVPLTVGFAAARSIVERRAGMKIAAERSTLARFQSPLLLDQLLKRARFSGKAGPPGCRRDVRGSVRVDRGFGGAWT